MFRPRLGNRKKLSDVLMNQLIRRNIYHDTRNVGRHTQQQKKLADQLIHSLTRWEPMLVLFFQTFKVCLSVGALGGIWLRVATTLSRQTMSNIQHSTLSTRKRIQRNGCGGHAGLRPGSDRFWHGSGERTDCYGQQKSKASEPQRILEKAKKKQERTKKNSHSTTLF